MTDPDRTLAEVNRMWAETILEQVAHNRRRLADMPVDDEIRRMLTDELDEFQRVARVVLEDGA